jgi:general secretion pathway protein D
MKSLVGQKVPIPQTTFTPIAAGGVSQQPITSFAYQDVGLEITIKPKIHLEKEITLEIEVKITAIAGSGYADIPIIANREIKNIIRLKDGETSVLAGLIRDDERNTVEGIPGLSDIPFIGRLFAHNTTERKETDIIVTLTPHIVRVLDLSEADLRPFRVGRDAGAPVLDLLDPSREAPALVLPKPIK